jgi:hypothetical protein
VLNPTRWTARADQLPGGKEMPKQVFLREQGRAVEGPEPARADALVFTVELWDAAKEGVERTIALTATGGTAYAAFHAALSEYPSRYISLRRNGQIISRVNPPTE